MKYVWVASSGSVRFGGCVDGVFATKEEAVKCAIDAQAKYGDKDPWRVFEDSDDQQTWYDLHDTFYVVATRWKVK